PKMLSSFESSFLRLAVFDLALFGRGFDVPFVLPVDPVGDRSSRDRSVAAGQCGCRPVLVVGPGLGLVLVRVGDVGLFGALLLLGARAIRLPDGPDYEREDGQRAGTAHIATG